MHEFADIALLLLRSETAAWTYISVEYTLQELCLRFPAVRVLFVFVGLKRFSLISAIAEP